MKHQRIIVYAKDIQRITGKGEKYSRKVLKEIREKLGKQGNQLVTVGELSEHLGIEENRLTPFLD